MYVAFKRPMDVAICEDSDIRAHQDPLWIYTDPPGAMMYKLRYSDDIYRIYTDDELKAEYEMIKEFNVSPYSGKYMYSVAIVAISEEFNDVRRKKLMLQLLGIKGGE